MVLITVLVDCESDSSPGVARYPSAVGLERGSF